MTPLTKGELIRLKYAFRRRDAAEKIINEARAKVPGKNKTHAHTTRKRCVGWLHSLGETFNSLWHCPSKGG